MNIFKIILVFLVLPAAMAETNCFVYKVGGKITSSGECSKRYPPQSTFKIAISLMGYNENILTDETHPEVPFVKGYPDSMESWKQPQTPQSWITNSCVWYSQYVTKKMGMKTFKDYVKKFNYGNQDVSGTPGKDGLTYSWITSSLKISPNEQVEFLDKFLNSQLPVEEKSKKYTRSILFLEDMNNGWKLYGKTGAGDLLKKDGSNDKTRERGWFVGWIERDKKRIIFAEYSEVYNLKNKQNNFGYVASKQSKEKAKERLVKIITDSDHKLP